MALHLMGSRSSMAVVIGCFLMVSCAFAGSSLSSGRPSSRFLESTSNDNGDGKILMAYINNVDACPPDEEVKQYTHLVIGFAVTYQYAEPKVTCSDACDISPVAICDGAKPDTISSWQSAGTKVLVSFGGGLEGDNTNDCWTRCFDKVDHVVGQLVELVQTRKFDGVNIDWEYPDFSGGATEFLQDLTTKLHDQLPADATVSHAPMDGDLDQGKEYYNLLKKVATSVDYLLPQYYTGHLIPGNPDDMPKVLDSMDHLITDMFGGDAGKVVFGFCAKAEGRPACLDGAGAVEVMKKVQERFPNNGGAYMWRAKDDIDLQWSTPVKEYFKSLN